MKRIRRWLCVNCIVLFLVAEIRLAAQDILKSSESYPAESSVFVYCGNIERFAELLTQTTLFQAIIDSPLANEWDLYSQEMQRVRREQKSVELFNNDESIAAATTSLLKGKFEFAIFPARGGNHWILDTEVNENNQTIQVLLDELLANNRVGNMTLKPFGKQHEWFEMIGEAVDKTGEKRVGGNLILKSHRGDSTDKVFIFMTPNRLVASSSDDLLLQTIAESHSLVAKGKRPLSTNRKFLEALNRIDAKNAATSDLVFYLDPSHFFENFLSDEKIISAEKSNLKETGFGEILSYGGRVSLEDPNFEMEMILYAGLALPKSGIHKILKTGALTQPVLIGVPDDVDFYFQATADFDRLKETMQKLYSSGTIPAQSSDFFNQKIVEYLTWLGRSSLYFDPTSASGEFDAFGWYYEHPNLHASRHVLRTFLGQGKSIIEEYFENAPGAKSVFEQRQLANQDYYRASEASMQEKRNYFARMRESVGMTGTEELANYAASIAEMDMGPTRYFGHFSSVIDFEKMLNGEYNTLDQKQQIDLLWKNLSRGEKPVFFGYVNADAFFRPVFYNRSARHAVFDTLLEKQVTGDKVLNENESNKRPVDFEERMKLHRAESSEKWSRTEFKSHFNCGGIGIYHTDKGYLIRFLQLR